MIVPTDYQSEPTTSPPTREARASSRVIPPAGRLPASNEMVRTLPSPMTKLPPGVWNAHGALNEQLSATSPGPYTAGFGQFPFGPELYTDRSPRAGARVSCRQQAESHQPHCPSAGGGRSPSSTVLLVPSRTASGVTRSGPFSFESSTRMPAFSAAGFGYTPTYQVNP